MIRLALFATLALGCHAPERALGVAASSSTQARFVLVESSDGALYTFDTEAGTVKIVGRSYGPDGASANTSDGDGWGTDNAALNASAKTPDRTRVIYPSPSESTLEVPGVEVESAPPAAVPRPVPEAPKVVELNAEELASLDCAVELDGTQGLMVYLNNQTPYELTSIVLEAQLASITLPTAWSNGTTLVLEEELRLKEAPTPGRVVRVRLSHGVRLDPSSQGHRFSLLKVRGIPVE